MEMLGFLTVRLALRYPWLPWEFQVNGLNGWRFRIPFWFGLYGRELPVLAC